MPLLLLLPSQGWCATPWRSLPPTRFIRYGQRNSFEQEAAARAVSRHFGLALARIDAGFLGDQLKALTVSLCGCPVADFSYV